MPWTVARQARPSGPFGTKSSDSGQDNAFGQAEQSLPHADCRAGSETVALVVARAVNSLGFIPHSPRLIDNRRICRAKREKNGWFRQ